jgi:hypothetical protein
MPSLSIERLRYYQRQYLGALDFEDEQAYHRSMRRRHNIGPHTWGIVAGLELDERLPAAGSNAPIEIHVLPGMAIDGFGREIVVLEPFRIDPDPQLFKGLTEAEYVPVWITYQEEPARQPAAGYEQCQDGDQATRVLERWRILVGPQPLLHQDIIVAGQVVHPATGTPTGQGLTIPADESVPYQELPDQEDPLPRWLVRLGSVNWDGRPGQRRFVPSDPVHRNEERRHVGAVAESIFGPAGVVRIRPRLAPQPPAADARAADVAVVEGPLRVEGFTTVDEDLLVHGMLGVGTDQPADRLQIGTGVERLVVGPAGDAPLDGTAYLAFNSSRSHDGDRKWTFAGDGSHNGGGALFGAVDGALHVATKASDGGGERTLTDDELLAHVHLTVAGSGSVGVGTTRPDAKWPLSIRPTGTSQELLSFLEPTTGATKWHLNQNLGGDKPGLNLAETGVADARLFIRAGGRVGIDTTAPRNPLGVRARDTWQELLSFEAPDGVTRWHLNQLYQGTTPGLNFSETGVADARLFLRAGGNVGIGTAEPTNRLHVDDAVGIRQGRQYLSGGLAGSSLSFNAHRNAANTAWVFPDPARPAVTVEMDTAVGGVGRLQVWGTTNGDPQGWVRRFDIDMESGRTLLAPSGGNVGIGTGTPTARLDVAGSARLSGKIGTLGFEPDSGLPSGWGGGVHTWDVYAEGTVGVGQGGALAAYLSSDGTVSGAIKSFVIAHPTDREGSMLVHAAVEGPELAVYYRGEAALAEGTATVTLPAYFEALTRGEGRTVLLTPIRGKGKVSALAASRVSKGRFTVTAIDGRNPAQAFYWEVKAIRADVGELVVETPKTPAAVGTLTRAWEA